MHFFQKCEKFISSASRKKFNGYHNGFDNAELKFDHFELIPKQEKFNSAVMLLLKMLAPC